MIKTIDEKNFNTEIIEASKNKPALLDFYGEWCGPCQMMMPLVEEIATEVGDKAIVGKVDIDASQALAEKYDVMGVPTFFVIKNGEIVETLNGAVPKDALFSALNKHIF